MRSKKYLAVGLAAAIPATLAMTDSVSADDVLYDTLWMVDAGSTNAAAFARISASSCTNDAMQDSHAADDFILDDTYIITSVAGDFASCSSFSGDGVLVEIFADADGTPSNTATAQTLATLQSGLTMLPIDPTGAPAIWPNGMRMSIDVADAGITLGPGRWWISISVVDEGKSSQPYGWLRMMGHQEEHVVHVRDGGVAHGNGYPGTWGTPNWTPISSFGCPTCVSGDLSMRIEGNPAEPKCAPADLDCSGTVGVPDLLLLLASWGECSDCEDCPADLTGNCAVGVPDLLNLLSNWG